MLALNNEIARGASWPIGTPETQLGKLCVQRINFFRACIAQAENGTVGREPRPPAASPLGQLATLSQIRPPGGPFHRSDKPDIV